MTKKIKIMDTILRDAHQSQAATRMSIDDMLPIAPLLDKIGYYALEVWGGATFDSCLRFLKIAKVKSSNAQYKVTNAFKRSKSFGI